MIRKFFFLLILNSIFLILNSFPAYAVAQFTTLYDITYTIDSSGTTTVSYDISQTNNLSSVYATQFALSVSQTDIQNISVKDENTPLTPDIISTDNITNITFPFANKVVGKDKVHHFSLSYKTKDIAIKIGSVWEVNIPRLTSNDGTASVNLTLKTHPDFSQLSFINPKPNRTEGNTYYFNSQSLANRSISAVFGDTQYFKFTLFYNLTNPTKNNLSTTINLPPDTQYQQIYYQDISPRPESVAIDPDGNWIATVIIPPKTDIRIKAEGVVKTFLKPSPMPLPDPSLYTRSNDYWPTNDRFRQIAQKLTTPESIYQYVVDYLHYDYSRLQGSEQRGGANFALDNPNKTICTDFTDLFISLARSKNIPARELQGYAFSSNDKLRPLSLSQDILHAWPEYYDPLKGTWVQIDPTWANTTNGINYFDKLDLNHIVFAIHGLNPQLPPPAGSYKTTNSKDVLIDPTSNTHFPTAEIDLEVINYSSDTLRLEVDNKSGVSAKGPLTINNASVNLDLPAYGNQVVNIPYKTKFSLKNQPVTVNILFNGQNYSKTFTLRQELPVVYLYATGAIVLVSIALIAGYLYLRRRKSHSPVHW